MADERTERAGGLANIPGSFACGQWEVLLADVLDGELRPEDEAAFSNHMANCPGCTALFEEARRGREWLEFLSPEPEVPAHLLERILAETGHGKMDVRTLAPAGGIADGNVLRMPPVWRRPGFRSRIRLLTEPRLMMTAAMAFFSIALTISVTGVKISSVRMADLRPTAVRSFLEKRIMTASTPVIRYYDHLRFVYEVESRMRELRRTTEQEQQNQQKTAQPSPQGGEGESHKKDGGSQLTPDKNDPNQAPQQTGNPPSSLWSDQMLDAKLRFQPQSKGFPKPAASSKTSGLALPEWSSTCIA